MSETCLRTVLIATTGSPAASRRRCRSRFSASVTPAGGAHTSAELPPVKHARTRSSGRASRRARAAAARAASLRALGSGWSASSTSRRSSGDASRTRHRAAQALAELGLERRGDRKARLPRPEHEHAGAGRERVRDAVDLDRVAGDGDEAVDRAPGIARGQAGVGHGRDGGPRAERSVVDERDLAGDRRAWADRVHGVTTAFVTTPAPG